MIADPDTIDLKVGTRERPRHEKKGRLTDIGWILLAMPCVLVAGIGIGLLAWLMSADGLNLHVLSIRLLSDVIDYLLMVAFISCSTLVAVKQLRRMVAVDAAETVRAVVREEIRVLLNAPGERIAADLGRIKDRLYLRPDDDPAEPPKHGPRPTHVIGVASPALYGPRLDAVIDRAAERLVEHFEEFGRQQHFKGYANCAEDMSGGAVVALSPRNGQRPTH